MHPLLTRLLQRADRAAVGSAVPAGSEPPDAGPPRPTARDRGAMRRRARALRRKREALLLELGALAFEMHRQDRRDDDLLRRRADEIARLDEEERGLFAALGERAPLVEVVAAGIAGPCPSCGELASTAARFCERCGTQLGSGLAPRAAADEAPAEEPAPGRDAAEPAEPPREGTEPAPVEPAPGVEAEDPEATGEQAPSEPEAAPKAAAKAATKPTARAKRPAARTATKNGATKAKADRPAEDS